MQQSPNRPPAQQLASPSSREQDPDGEESRSERALGTVQEHTQEVASHAVDEARGVAEEAVDRLHQEAERQTHHVQQMLAKTGTQLEALADGRVEDAGPLVDYARRAATKVDDLATRMDQRGFDGMVSEVSDYARRKPGRFLLISAAAGVAVGRIGRGVKRSQQGQSEGGRPGASGPPRYSGAGTSAGSGHAGVNLLPETTPDVPPAPGVPPGYGTAPSPPGAGIGEVAEQGAPAGTGLQGPGGHGEQRHG